VSTRTSAQNQSLYAQKNVLQKNVLQKNILQKNVLEAQQSVRKHTLGFCSVHPEQLLQGFALFDKHFKMIFFGRRDVHSLHIIAMGCQERLEEMIFSV
jgi:hypothetical protein